MDLEKLQYYVDNGYIDKRPHPFFPYDVYNYTFKTEIDREWNELTRACRGLVMDRYGVIMGRPFPKFFNLDEHLTKVGPLPQLPYEVREKWDGSMLSVFWTPFGVLCNTRGSFTSEQAIKGWEILNRKYGTVWVDPYTTYIFELIYPENRIVVNYGDMEDLVLIGAIETVTGREPRSLDEIYEWWGPRAAKYSRPLDALLPPFNNDEGVVVRFADGTRVKVKQDEYKRLHRVMTNITEYDIWEMLQVNEEMFNSLPDEVLDWANGVRSWLEADFKLLNDLVSMWYDIKYDPDPKQFALNVNSNDTQLTQFAKTCLFMKYNGRDYSKHIWKQITPKKIGPFKMERVPVESS